MKAVIIGGGKVGYNLLRTLKNKGYNITLVERDRSLCEKIAEAADGEIICGDGTDIDLLREIGIEEADVVAAVTGKDEENFVICQIVRINFNIGQIIARVNNPKNTEIFKAIGVGKVVCSTQVIANLMENELSKEKLKVVQTIERGEMVLVEAEIDKKSLWTNKIISALDIPEGCIIVSIIREDRLIAPKGGTLIMNNDKVMIVTSVNNRQVLERSIWGD